MTPEVHKVVLDARRGIKRCKAMNAELRGRIARLQHLDHIASTAANADQLKTLLRMMQASTPTGGGPEPVARLPEAA